MTSSTFFINLYQRPIQANPVVALKGLITTLKLLQQGPEQFLCECVRHLLYRWDSLSIPCPEDSMYDV